MRILTEIPDSDIEKLDRLAVKDKTSRAAIIRSAITRFLNASDGDCSWIERGYGLWADREDIGDGVEYQRAMREDRRPYEDI